MPRFERGRGLPVVAVIAFGATVVVIVLGALLTLGVGGSANERNDSTRAPEATMSSTPGSATPSTVVRSDADDRVAVRMVASSDALRSAPVVDELDDGEVLRVRVANLRPYARGRVRQCVRVPAGFAACTNEFPIQVDEDGAAYFQYQVTDAPRRCDVASSCVLVATDGDDGVALAYMLFGAPAPPPAVVRLRPAGPYRSGARVDVEAAPVPPGAKIEVAFCTPECRVSTDTTADATGLARAVIVLGRGCDRGDRCAIVVTGLATRDAITFVRFASGPTAGYESWRLLIGLSAAALLLLAAWSIVRRTDWRAPTEAATPALDEASL